MERPTCRTCPYWEERRDKSNDEPLGYGDCRRDAAVVALLASTGRTFAQSFWCGDHPDFPKYLAEVFGQEGKD